MGMSYNILPLETFAYVQQQAQPTYQIAPANIAVEQLDASQNQLFITAPAICDTRQEKLNVPAQTQQVQQEPYYSVNQIQTDYQTVITPVTLNAKQIGEFVNSRYNGFSVVDNLTSAAVLARSTSVAVSDGDRPVAEGTSYLSVQNISTDACSSVQNSTVQLATTAINLIQVPSNLLVANNNLILCLPPEGITLQLPVNEALVTTSIVTSSEPQQSQNNMVDKARDWLKDSDLVIRGLIALSKIK